MKIKHSKLKNTGLIYELLVKQITSDLISRRSSPAVEILRKYFSGDSALVQEHKLYKGILEGVDLSTDRANYLIQTTMEEGRKLDSRKLAGQRYNLVAEIKQHYDLEDFFSLQVKEYKSLAALYCLLEAERSRELLDPQFIVTNKVTLLEHMTCRYQPEKDVIQELVKEYSNYDRDLRLLTFKVLLEKYNQKYGNLLPEQKEVLRDTIAMGSARELREYVNSKFGKVRVEMLHLHSKMNRGIEKIKLMEAIKMLEPIQNTEKVTDAHLVRLLQFYDLMYEIKKVI